MRSSMAVISPSQTMESWPHPSSSGSFRLLLDVYGHIIEAYTGDGRRLFYEYDSTAIW